MLVALQVGKTDVERRSLGFIRAAFGSSIRTFQMARAEYHPHATMREARSLYFQVNKFGDSGGYDDPWVDFKLGPIPMPFPNTPGRVRAVRYHDLHHVLTGYDTDIAGEFEISAWEIAAGCKGFVAAWQLNLGGMVGGLLVAPRRTLRAFLRGRHSRTLYGDDLEALLQSRVGELRARTGVDTLTPSPRLADVVLFGLSLAAGLVVGLIGFALTLVFLPLGLATFAWRRSSPRSRRG